MAAAAVAGEGVGFASGDAGDRGEDDFQERAVVGGNELGSDDEASSPQVTGSGLEEEPKV
eukprot:5715473-Pleurochrysis_carterae.AAC.1